LRLRARAPSVRLMARAIALIAVSAAAIALLSAPGQAAAPFGKVTCDTRKASFLFWPDGHPKLKEPGFGEFRTPHLEVYRGLKETGFGSKNDVYVDPRGAISSQDRCTAGNPKPLEGKVPNSQKRTKATNIQCRFGNKVILEFTKINDGVKVTGLRKDGTKVLELKILNSNSTAVYNKERCEPKPPPK
jgi:hypothetical protein